MAKLNINFNNTAYTIDDSVLSDAKSNLTSHLSTTMNGSGSTISFNGIIYNIDAEKLSTAKDKLVSHLGTISGSGEKVVINDIEYEVDSTKVADAFTVLHEALDVLEKESRSVRLVTSDGYYVVDLSGVFVTVKE